jgi:protein-L-isoaspartate(D-aspartate) O-methyltransferase
MPGRLLQLDRERMVERQLRRRGIVDERVLAAMARVPRELFVPADERGSAYADNALPIGRGQTISQPYMVARICQELGLDGRRARVLDVGAGSGYQAAVLAELGAEVIAVELIPELAERARANLAAAGYDGVEVRVGDGGLGVPERAPFAAIAVAAAARELPETLYEQLEPGGRLVVPVGGREEQFLLAIEKSAAGRRVRYVVPCRFVPLVGRDGFPEPPAGEKGRR